MLVLAGNDRNSCRIEAGLVLDLIKEALPELAKEAGYVKLADDQELPDNVCENDDGKDFTIGYELAQQDILKAGWRKVKVIPTVKGDE